MATDYSVRVIRETRYVGKRRDVHGLYWTGLFLLGVVGLMGITGAAHGESDAVPAEAKAVFIIVDGIPADVIERVATPALDDIAAAGGYTRAQMGGPMGTPAQTPTVSAPGYMSLVTGTWADKHNVRANDELEPNYDYWSLFRLAKSIEPPLTTGLFSTWTDNRTVLLGQGLPATDNLAIDYVADGFEHDSLGFPHREHDQHIEVIDRHVAAEAARVIAAEGPHLSWVYLQYTDDVAHASGDGPDFDAAVGVMDGLVGQIWAAVAGRQAQYGEDWLILVTTDHGRDAETGQDHGGQSLRERTTWMVTNSQRLNPAYYSQPEMVDIYPSIVAHLGLPIPQQVAAGLDGSSFID